MPLQRIGKMTLKNEGGFVARIQFAYLDDDGNEQFTGESPDILLGQSNYGDPGEYGIPDNTGVRLRAYVVAGPNKDSNKWFSYEKGNPVAAHYVISGPVWGADLGLMDVS